MGGSHGNSLSLASSENTKISLLNSQSVATQPNHRQSLRTQVSFNTGKMDNSHLPLFSTIEAMTKTAKIRHFIFVSLGSSSLCYSAESVDWELSKFLLAHTSTRFTGSTFRGGTLPITSAEVVGWENIGQDPFNVTFTAQ